MRFDEQYADGKLDTLPPFYQHLKFIPLSGGKQVYLTVGGEVRLEYADFTNEDWGRYNLGRNRFLLQRYTLHTDLRLGSRVRVFAQFRSALENGRKNGPRPIDEDQLNVQNLFAEVNLLKNEVSRFTLRVGRQELDYGSGRLLSVREGPNVRLYFTGVKVMYTYRNASIDGLLMMADTLNPGVFDNKGSGQANLWGFYSRSAFSQNRSVEGYYIGIRRDQSTYEEGVAKEVRHTIGTRFAKTGSGLLYNLEAAYQFGQFGRGLIRAWTASVDVSYSFANRKYKPLVGLKHDYISGDRQREDGWLETFNALYPKAGYFGFDPQIGPSNLIDVHPYGSLQLGQTLAFQWDVVFNWRYSLWDGVYRPSGSYNLEGTGSTERYIGTAYLGKLVYGINAFLSADFGLQYFQSGPFIRRQIRDATNAFFTNTRIVFKF